jgi:hypothetical protein
VGLAGRRLGLLLGLIWVYLAFKVCVCPYMAKEKPSTVIPLNEEGIPDPEVLNEIAEHESPKIHPELYWGTVCTLRKKGFTWIEVSEWLARAGVNLHHKKLSRYAAELLAEDAAAQIDSNEEGAQE